MQVTAAMINELREKASCSLMESQRALKKYNGDMLLAEGYLKYNGCAINVGSKENYKIWVDEMAHSWKNSRVKEQR